jgi:hypothetical protein
MALLMSKEVSTRMWGISDSQSVHHSVHHQEEHNLIIKEPNVYEKKL